MIGPVLVLAGLWLFYGRWWNATLYAGLAAMVGVSLWDLLSHRGHAEGAAPGDEILGLLRDRDVAPASVRNRGAVADHLEGKAACARDPGQHMAPERRRGRDPVDEDEWNAGATSSQRTGTPSTIEVCVRTGGSFRGRACRGRCNGAHCSGPTMLGVPSQGVLTVRLGSLSGLLSAASRTHCRAAASPRTRDRLRRNPADEPAETSAGPQAGLGRRSPQHAHCTERRTPPCANAP